MHGRERDNLGISLLWIRRSDFCHGNDDLSASPAEAAEAICTIKRGKMRRYTSLDGIRNLNAEAHPCRESVMMQNR